VIGWYFCLIDRQGGHGSLRVRLRPRSIANAPSVTQHSS
jgi:hypothetical protein